MQVSPKVRAHLYKAQQDFGKAELSAASTEVKHALEIDPDCAQAFTMKALIELRWGKFQDAVADATHATSLDPGDALSLLTLATAANSRGNFEQAAAAAQRALQTQPNLWQGHLEVAKAFYGQEQFMEALRELDSIKTDFPDVHLVRADALMRLGSTQKAAAEFAVFLSESPRDSRNERIKKIVAGITDPPAREDLSLNHK